MEQPPKTGIPLPAAAETWESEGDSVTVNPRTPPTLRLVSNKGMPVNNRQPSLPDEKRAQLRTLVETINREMARLPRPAEIDVGDESTDELIVSWSALVGLLGLGPAPETRECPVCAHVGMLAATRCGYCWAPLPTPATTPVGPPAENRL